MFLTGVQKIWILKTDFHVVLCLSLSKDNKAYFSKDQNIPGYSLSLKHLNVSPDISRIFRTPRQKPERGERAAGPAAVPGPVRRARAWDSGDSWGSVRHATGGHQHRGQSQPSWPPGAKRIFERIPGRLGARGRDPGTLGHANHRHHPLAWVSLERSGPSETRIYIVLCEPHS